MDKPPFVFFSLGMGCLYLYYFNSAHSELLGAKKMPKSVSQTRMWKLDDIYANKNSRSFPLKKAWHWSFCWIPMNPHWHDIYPLGFFSTASTVPWGPRCESNWRRKRTWNRRRCGKSCPGRLEKMAMLWLCYGYFGWGKMPSFHHVWEKWW